MGAIGVERRNPRDGAFGRVRNVPAVVAPQCDETDNFGPVDRVFADEMGPSLAKS